MEQIIDKLIDSLYNLLFIILPVIVGGVMTIKQTKFEKKLNLMEEEDEQLYEQRLLIHDIERKKTLKMEESVVANHDLTAEIARHIIEGNHLDILKQRSEHVNKLNNELKELQKEANEAMDKYYDMMRERGRKRKNKRLGRKNIDEF